jgi:hypothetical protein
MRAIYTKKTGCFTLKNGVFHTEKRGLPRSKKACSTPKKRGVLHRKKGVFNTEKRLVLR